MHASGGKCRQAFLMRLPTREVSFGAANVLSLSCSARARVPKPRDATPATSRAANGGAGECRAACRPPNYDGSRGFSPGPEPGAASSSEKLGPHVVYGRLDSVRSLRVIS